MESGDECGRTARRWRLGRASVGEAGPRGCVNRSINHQRLRSGHGERYVWRLRLIAGLTSSAVAVDLSCCVPAAVGTGPARGVRRAVAGGGRGGGGGTGRAGRVIRHRPATQQLATRRQLHTRPASTLAAKGNRLFRRHIPLLSTPPDPSRSISHGKHITQNGHHTPRAPARRRSFVTGRAGRG